MAFLSVTIPVFPASAELTVWDICLRLLCAMAVGLVIGTEREYTNRPAGLRTHILVALGACAVMITGQLVFVQYKALGGTPDPSRLAAQVITGVGFLGAGTILREGVNVKGLTTAASLWTVACLGIAAGGGYYAVALMGTVFTFITLTLFEILQHKLTGPHGARRAYRLETDDITCGLRILHEHARAQRIDIQDMLAEKTEDGYRITFRASLGGSRGKKRREKFFEALAGEACVLSLQELQTAEVN